MKIEYIIHSDERGGYWAEVPALPGCVTEGRTLDELAANVKDAAEGCVAVILERYAETSKGSKAYPSVGHKDGKNGMLSLAFRSYPLRSPRKRRSTGTHALVMA